MYKKTEQRYETLKGLILTGVKKEGQQKGPTLIPGFRNGQPRISIFFNDEGNSNLFLEPDYNSFIIFCKLAIKVFEQDEDKEQHLIVQGAKFIDGTYIPNELTFKGGIYFGVKKGTRYLKFATETLNATFTFREPFRGKFFKEDNTSVDQAEVSEAYGVAFIEGFYIKAVHHQGVSEVRG